jgi:hypothetical protein
MAEAVYVLCFLTSAAVAVLLLRGFVKTRSRLLLWCGLGFVGLCLNNLMLVIDVMVVPEIDLSMLRNLPALAGMAVVIFGLIWDGG